jgi:hypothetical protein
MSRKVNTHFWAPHPGVQSLLLKWYNHPHSSIHSRIIDIGAGALPFALATDTIDLLDKPQEDDRNRTTVDIDFERFPFDDHTFEVAYCRHTIEDLQNPNHALQEIFRVAKRGYIETPSPLIECLRGVDAGSPDYRGYIHHRYIVYSDIETNTIHCFPKFPLVEYTVFQPDTIEQLYHLAENPLYWNNYYTFSQTEPPSFRVYRHGIDMNVLDYSTLIQTAIEQSLRYTDAKIKPLLES